jgi:cell division transport system ATP-binding protein
MVEFKNITYNYSSKSGIYNVDLNIQDDEFCFLVGPTGSGKSTLLKLLYFDFFPDKGEVNVLGYSSSKIKTKDIHKARKKIGVIFQD